MKVPLSWLRDYVDIQLDAGQLAERLTVLGMEVKGVERWGSDWRSVVVGELLTVEKHPRADRLSLTTVRVGGDEVLEIVCGATNIRPGQRVPVALPGAVLPGGRAIERTQKMGVTSNGMLCSGDELRITTDGDGILILPPGTPLGVELSELYGDDVLDVDVKPNRGDALCLVGLAREVSAATGAPIRWPETDPAEGSTGVGERLAVEVANPELCPRFAGRWVSGVTIGPSPDLVQMRLRAAGMRPVSNVVDASNYVMLELGKPIHTFDARTVARDEAGRAHIVVRLARSGERLETLDHVERSLDPETLLIADANGPLAIAGVMGGADSEISDATTDIIVESAIFDPVNIRRTGHRYALRSEASLRFEKGQDLRLARIGADRCARLIQEWAGGEVATGRVDTAPTESADARVAFRPARVNRLLGTDIGAEDQARLLARVGVAVSPAVATESITIALAPQPRTVSAAPEGTLIASIPTWRRDLVIEADIAEEIARIHGYERVPAVVPDTPMPVFRASALRLRDTLRETLAGAGLSEVVTSALVAAGLLPSAVPLIVPRPSTGPDLAERAGPLEVTNPLSAQHAVLRQGLVGSLLEVVSANVRRGRQDVAVFEVGKGYGQLDGQSHEWWRLGFALTGGAEPPSWNRVARPWDLDDAKGLVELLAMRLGYPVPTYAALGDDPALHPGRAASVTAGNLISGFVGELHPSLAEPWGFRAERVIVAELAIAGLAGGQVRVPTSVALVRQPAVERDVAIVVDEAVPAAAVAAAIRSAAGPLLEQLRLFDVYRGAPLGPTEKSLAERLVFRAPDRTLIDEEIDGLLAVVTAELAARLGARLRT